MEDTAQLRLLIEGLYRKFDDLQRIVIRRKPYTRAEFAEAAKISYRTVQRMIKAKEIREVNGRIPAHYLDKYLS